MQNLTRSIFNFFVECKKIGKKGECLTVLTVPSVDTEPFTQYVEQAGGYSDLRKQESVIRHRQISVHFHGNGVSDGEEYYECDSEHECLYEHFQNNVHFYT
tara:strand:+ start:827 stop:1129 length:303 start_codon:yes stop_codon:yes gene_type:complete